MKKNVKKLVTFEPQLVENVEETDYGESVTDVKNYKPSIDSIRAMVRGASNEDNMLYDFTNGEIDGEITRRKKLFYSDIAEIEEEEKEVKAEIEKKKSKAKTKRETEELSKKLKEEKEKEEDRIIAKLDNKKKTKTE